MLYAVRNIVPLLVIAHPLQPGDGGTSWRLEEYITPCQHILAEYIAEHIGGYITKHNEEYMGKYTQKYIKIYTTFCQQLLDLDTVNTISQFGHAYLCLHVCIIFYHCFVLCDGLAAI